MADIRERLRALVAGAVEKVAGADLAARTSIEAPRTPEHGDFATNIALALAKELKRKPLDIAGEIAAAIPADPLIAKVEIKPPGFINFFVAQESAAAILLQIAADGARYGWLDEHAGQTAIVEYVSANPTGPLHIGHARNAALGDCVARALERVGFKVWREYYYNDAGAQMKRLGESVHARYLEACGDAADFPEDGYHGDYIRDIANRLHAEHGDAWRGRHAADFAAYAKAIIEKLIDADMDALGIRFDLKFSEVSLHESGQVDKTLARLRELGKTYEKEGATWLRTEEAGDEADRVLIKQDGEKTYLAPDLAYHAYKYDRGFDLLVNLLGADHHSYVVRLTAGCAALGYDPARLNCIVYQLVTVMRGGEIVRFGKRAGEYITVREMIDELGTDAIRFFFNMRKGDSHMTFDWDLAKEQSQQNPVYYVQYAHARCCSILRKAAEQDLLPGGWEVTKLALLNALEEQRLIKTLAEYPRIVAASGNLVEPHHYTAYLRTVAEQLNAYFTAGNVNAALRVLVEGHPELARARLLLITATRTVLANALDALGVSAPESM